MSWVREFGEVMHWSSLVPVGAAVYTWFKGRSVSAAAWLMAVSFVLSFATDVTTDLTARPGGNNYWVLWVFSPAELIVLAFAVSRTPMALVMAVTALGITDGILLQTGVAHLTTAPPMLSLFGWIMVAAYANWRGTRAPLIRKGVILYACGVGLAFNLVRVGIPDRMYLFHIGYFALQAAKIGAIVLSLIEVGLLKVPARGLAFISLIRTLRLDRPRPAGGRAEALVRELKDLLGAHVALLPEALCEAVNAFIEDPKQILTTGELAARLNIDRRSIERAHKRAGLPTPLRLQQILRLAHAHALLKDQPGSTFESIAGDTGTDARTLRRYADTVLGVTMDEFANGVRTSQIVASLMYESDRRRVTD